MKKVTLFCNLMTLCLYIIVRFLRFIGVFLVVVVVEQ